MILHAAQEQRPNAHFVHLCTLNGQRRHGSKRQSSQSGLMVPEWPTNGYPTATTSSSANRELRPEVRTLLCEVVASVFCECLRASQTLRAAEAVVDISSVCEVRVFIKSGIVLLRSVCDKKVRQSITITGTIKITLITSLIYYYYCYAYHSD